jgi:hypothetical protein
MNVPWRSFTFWFWPIFLLAVLTFLNIAGFWRMEMGSYTRHGFPFTFAVRYKGGTWSFEPFLLLLDVAIGMAVFFLGWTMTARRFRKQPEN